MAHDKCIGTWINSKLGGADDGSGNLRGRFIVNDHAGADGVIVPITGTHLGRQGLFLAGKCNGDVITFAVEDLLTKQLICYLNGVLGISGLNNTINGKFSKPLQTGVGLILVADDWTAEKPT
jgi:hypothetical protein